jgi:hypothetical protein
LPLNAADDARAGGAYLCVGELSHAVAFRGIPDAVRPIRRVAPEAGTRKDWPETKKGASEGAFFTQTALALKAGKRPNMFSRR